MCCIIILIGLESQMFVLYHYYNSTADFTRRNKMFELYHYFNRTGKSDVCAVSLL